MNYSPPWASFSFSFQSELKAGAHVNAEICPVVQRDRQMATGRQRFSWCVRRLLDIHSSVASYHCFMIIKCPHSGSPPCLLLLAVHLFARGPCVWPCCADHSLMISKTAADPFHTHTLDEILFSKLLILLLSDPLTSFPFF